MCGRFSLGTPAGDLAAALGLPEPPGFTPRFNIAPTQTHPVVRAGAAAPEWCTARWGLVPPWAKEAGLGARMINARAETLAEKPAFRAAFRRRRCLVPADGFYEWTGQGPGRRPHFIGLAGGEPFTFAGLWEVWTAASGEVLLTFTIITTEANALLRPLHDRMPVILPPARRAAWIDPAITDPGLLKDGLVPYPPAAMRHFPVGTFVNNPRHEGPACREPGPPG